ncbi:ferric reductase-like transmembrane domain-containing protein [Methanosarcina sp.]|uniref:ferric reductase-like transmembrane domain-containing protein n=1 Tax=Methanosarcina sp. TaxID=2213 RepID=UPI003C734C72
MGKDKAGKYTGQSTGKDSSGKGVSNKRFYPIYGIILLIIAFITYIILQDPEEPVGMIRRFAGTFGYLTIFLAIVTSEYMAKMKKISGLPFMKAHHNLARIAILLILIHPLTFVLQGRGVQIFSPISPTNVFIGLAGRPALYLFLLAAGVALYRKKYKNWREVHYLNYLAFLLVSIHALMLGDDFRLSIMRIFALAMAVTVIAIFIHKRSASGQKKR